MPFSTLFEKTRSGVFNIVYQDAVGNRLASGSAFVCLDFLITNAHVFKAPANAAFVRVRNDSTNPISFDFPVAEFRSRLKASSDESNYDFAVLDVPEIVKSGVHQFEISTSPVQIGEQIVFLGFPYDHRNVTCHSGILSSKYRSGPAEILQLDASVNPSNSGGPLLKPLTLEVIGIVTRRATGLTGSFNQLREVIRQNISVLTFAKGGVRISGIDPIEALLSGSHQMLNVIAEIERQANVGIGYAFSIDHLRSENVVSERLERKARNE